MLEFLDESLSDAEFKVFKKVVGLHFRQAEEQDAELLKRTVAWIEEEARRLYKAGTDAD